MRIEFIVNGKPPRKSKWGRKWKDAPLVVKYRKAVLDARNNAKIQVAYKNPIRVNLTMYAPNVFEKDYKQNGNYDPKKFPGDLDNRVAGICEYLHSAKAKDKTFKPHDDLCKGDDIDYKNSLIIKDDSQIVEISARKKKDEKERYHVEIVFLDENLKELD